ENGLHPPRAPGVVDHRGIDRASDDLAGRDRRPPSGLRNDLLGERHTHASPIVCLVAFNAESKTRNHAPAGEAPVARSLGVPPRPSSAGIGRGKIAFLSLDNNSVTAA